MTDRPRPKASARVTITALAALSLTFAATACDGGGRDVTADCVIKQNDGKLKAVDDSLCKGQRASGGGVAPVWVYGGSSRSGYVSGGSYSKPAGANITSRSGTVISRGGFGGKAGGGS